ncbi:MAG: c-type cytochrome [Nitrospinae bacterium]|nr:c-type cytochrome [Nitrospinota bacterium]
MKLWHNTAFVMAAAALITVAVPAEAKKHAKEGGYKWDLPAGIARGDLKIPADNPMTNAKVELGRLLYFDKRLSADDTVACASCHAPEHGFTDNAPVSTGIKGQKGGRSAPTVINRALSEGQFWDGRAISLEAQAKGPLTNPIEMGMPDHDAVVAKLKNIKGYQKMFARAFGKPGVNIDRVAQAIAAFERTVLSGNSKYDRHQAGDKKAMNEAEARGMELFNGKARCATCHNGVNFTDEQYHNIGVGMAAKEPDVGRQNVTKGDADKGAFKTPTVRDITATGPYMHNGQEKTLEEVVAYYNKGGFPNANLDPLMEPLNLTDGEQKDVVAFMKALDGQGGWKNITAPKKFPK